MAETIWDGDSEFRQRRYDTYQAYLEHQAAKLRTLNLTDYNQMFKPALMERVSAVQPLMDMGRGANVLCLGARNGIECEAFIELGFFAIGIDLNPGAANRYVVTGDFHALQFGDNTVDAVFTNALDHAFDIAKIVSEVGRVLRPGGLFIADIVRGSKDEDGREPGAFESAWWDKSEAVVAQIENQQLKLLDRRRFDAPWVGDQCLFSRT